MNIYSEHNRSRASMFRFTVTTTDMITMYYYLQTRNYFVEYFITNISNMNLLHAAVIESPNIRTFYIHSSSLYVKCFEFVSIVTSAGGHIPA